MKCIQKYKLEIKPVQRVVLPRWHNIMTVAMEDDVPCLYAEVDIDSMVPQAVVTIIAYASGSVLKSVNQKHLGTVRVNNSTLHFYKEEPWETLTT